MELMHSGSQHVHCGIRFFSVTVLDTTYFVSQSLSLSADVFGRVKLACDISDMSK